MDISLFLNTRNRVGLLKDLLDSIVDTTFAINNIELLITADDDDAETISFLQSYKDIPNLRVLISTKPSNLHSSINNMANQCSGDFLFVLNDDVVFLTPQWDKKLLSLYSDLKNEIYYIGTQDSSIDKTHSIRYPSFPILTRKAYESLGFFMSEKFVSHGGDVHLWRIFNAIGKVVMAPIALDHVMHNNIQNLQLMHKDKTAQAAIKLTFSDFVDCWKEDISEEIQALQENA